jgi:hypothetical protein
MSKVVLAIIIILVVITAPIWLFILYFLMSSLYSTNDVTSMAERLNQPWICYFAPFDQNCGTELPCRKPEVCFNNFAVKNKNYKACDYISVGGLSADKANIDLRNQCYLASGAPLRETAKKCFDISERESWSRGDCFGFFATQLKDQEVCQGIEDGEIRARCYLTYVKKIFNPDPNICAQVLPAKYIDDCYLQIAWNKKDLSLCQKIKDPETVKFCKNEILND